MNKKSQCESYPNPFQIIFAGAYEAIFYSWRLVAIYTVSQCFKEDTRFFFFFKWESLLVGSHSRWLAWHVYIQSHLVEVLRYSRHAWPQLICRLSLKSRTRLCVSPSLWSLPSDSQELDQEIVSSKQFKCLLFSSETMLCEIFFWNLMKYWYTQLKSAQHDCK